MAKSLSSNYSPEILAKQQDVEAIVTLKIRFD